MRHPHPPRPPMEGGVLLPKIVARERIDLPCFPAELCLSDLPCGARPPYRLQWVRACGQTAVLPGCRPDVLILRIPLTVQFCDACGKAYTAAASVEAQICAPRCVQHGCHHLLWASPEVRLLESACADGSCFCTTLSIGGDVYLLHMEPCMTRAPRPACPQLPLYPPPMC